MLDLHAKFGMKCLNLHLLNKYCMCFIFFQSFFFFVENQENFMVAFIFVHAVLLGRKRKILMRKRYTSSIMAILNLKGNVLQTKEYTPWVQWIAATDNYICFYSDFTRTMCVKTLKNKLIKEFKVPYCDGGLAIRNDLIYVSSLTSFSIYSFEGRPIRSWKVQLKGSTDCLCGTLTRKIAVFQNKIFMVD